MPSVIPFFGSARENTEIASEAGAAIHDVLCSGRMLQSQWVEAFEDGIAAAADRQHAVAVGSATDALFFALIALGVGPGDEVVTTDLSFIPSASCILRAGATPVLVDVADDCNLDLDRAAAAIGPRTRAMIFVHLFGGLTDPARVAAFASRHGIALVEDASQAFGAAYGRRPAGSTGDISVFSFDPTKVLSAPGSGGCAVTNDGELAGRLRRLRYHGKEQGAFLEPGYNSQMSSLTAVVLDIKLQRQHAWSIRRRQIAEVYDKTLDRLGWKRPHWDPAVVHARHKYVFLAPDRDRLRDHLLSHGVPTMIHYAVPFHEEPVFSAHVDDPTAYPRSSAFARATLSLPVNGHLEDEEIAQIVFALEAFQTTAETVLDTSATVPALMTWQVGRGTF